jgi:hypothetical protein
MSRKVGLRLALGALIVLALLQAFFAVDVAWRVWATRSGFERAGDALLIVMLEAARALALVLATAGAVLIARGAERFRAPLAVACAALALWYSAAFGFPGFAGYVQTRVAVALRGAGLPDPLIIGVFGDAGWPLWVAVAAALRAAALLLSDQGAGAAEVRTDTTTRPGLLRGSAVAGLDVGAAFLRAAAGAVERGWLSARVVWGAATLGILLHLAGPAALGVPLAVVLAAGAALAFTLFRTAYRRGAGRNRVTLRWMATGAALALAGFLVGGAFALLAPGQAILSFLILATTPVLVAACLAAAGTA